MAATLSFDVVFAAGLGVAVGETLRRAIERWRRARRLAVPVERALRSLPANHLLLTSQDHELATEALNRLERRLGGSVDDAVWVPLRLDLASVDPEALADRLAIVLLGSGEPGRSSAGAGAPSHVAAELARGLGRKVRERERLEGGPVQVVLLLDHAELIEGWPPRAAQQLRSLLSHPEAVRLACVAAGVGLARRWSEPSSPWFNLFDEIQLDRPARHAPRRP
jgi:hypothetical protein